MENKQRKKLVCALTCAVVIVETFIIAGLLVSDMGGSDPSIQETDYIWVDFSVSGWLTVEVPDSNCGEVPDEAWEEAERILGEYSEYSSMNLEVNNYGTFTEVISP